MRVIKGYFRDQLQLQMFMLEHEDVSEFYLSAFQRKRSALPLLILRTIICFGCIAILISSAVLSINFMPLPYWPIFLTHWGLVLNTIAAAFGVLVSSKAYFQGSIDSLYGLPCYVKMYWAMTNISTTIAFFITVFYWSFLSMDVDEEYAANRTLDIFIHAVNAILMFVLLTSARQPMRLLHVYQPISVAVIYLIFSVIYYYAGGTNPGTDGTYIYPPLDWSLPGLAMITVALSLVLLIILHAISACLVIIRDKLSRYLFRDNEYTVYR
ncbi:protein rolling stone-like [Battus philenor]|uniref:protein rolling stone-like n=1 Tax=Battus philenor TaxID=42288 RepID=UPI0035CF1DFD